MRIGIFPNLSKPNIEKYVADVCTRLHAADMEYVISDSYRAEAEERGYTLGDGNWLPLAEMLPTMDMAFSLGGDGTIIAVAKQLHRHRIPVCGINLGELGFLNVVEPEDLDRRLAEIKAGEYELCERSVLSSCILHEDGRQEQLPIAMNEVVIGRSRPGRMARLRLYINDVFVEEYPSDGIIVTTATGSSGYAMSCGGPIMHPSSTNIVAVPICPHLLKNSPILLAPDDVVTITMPEREKHLYASVDGNESFCFTHQKKLKIYRDAETIPFVYFRDQRFFRLLFPKLTKSIYHAVS